MMKSPLAFGIPTPRFVHRPYVGLLVAALMGSNAYGAKYGGGAGDNPSRITDMGGSLPPQGAGDASPDIYNPEAYRAVEAFDSAGVYVLIWNGKSSYVMEAGTKRERKIDMDFKVRTVVELRRAGKNNKELRIFSRCSGKDWGPMSRDDLAILQHTDSNAKFSGDYKGGFTPSSSPDANEESEWNPLQVGPGSEHGTGTDMKDVTVDARIDLLRLGDIQDSVGRANFSYKLGDISGAFRNACFKQFRMYNHVFSPRLKNPNRGEGVHEMVTLSSADSSVYLGIILTHADAVALGSSFTPKGWFAGIMLDMRAPNGKTWYYTTQLEKYGETGDVEQVMVRNDTAAMEFHGSATPTRSSDGKPGRFAPDSLPATYRISLPLK